MKMIKKKTALTTIVVFTVMISFVYPVLAADVSVSRSMPGRVDPQGTLTVSFTITPTETLSNFDLAELMPQTWTIKDWSVSGFEKSNIDFDVQESQSFMGSTYNGYHWKFNAELTSTATLTYTLDVPVSSGSYGFVGIWTYPGGFEKDEATLSVAVATTTTTAPTTTTVPTTTTLPPIELPKETMLYIAAAIILVVVFILWKAGKLGKLSLKRKKNI